MWSLMTHSIPPLRAWVGWWGLKCKKAMRDDEADGAQMGVLEEKGRFSFPFALGSSGASVGELF